MEVEKKEIFYFKFKQQQLDSFSENYFNYYIFIGGFLSRLIHNKSFRVCFYAGQLLLDKLFKIKIKKKFIYKIDDYNVLVPNEKKSTKERIIKIKEKMMEEKKLKEKGFILDCTNLNECKIKEYNPLLDNSCSRYLLNKNNFEHLKNAGFINKNGIVLKDPDKYEKAKLNVSHKKKVKTIILENDNYNNLKLPLIQNNNIVCQTAKRTKDNRYLKNLFKNKEKTYYKTINNFYGLKNAKIKNNTIYKTNFKDNSKSKNKLKNVILNNENNKIQEYLAKTSKNFKFKNKSNSNSKQKVKLRKIQLIEDREKLNFNKKIPKYDTYSKYLFQLYRPDLKLPNDCFEIKNKSNKKAKLKGELSKS